MAKMTVSQGLRAIADLKGKLAKHQKHAEESILFYKHAQPAFDFKTEIQEAEVVRNNMLRFQTAIAVSNATTKVDWKGKKVLVAWAIRHLEELKSEKAFIDSLTVAPQHETQEEHHRNGYVNGQLTQIDDPYTKICALPEAEQFKRSQMLQEAFNCLNDVIET